MKLRHILPAALLGAALLPGLTACDDDFDYPPVIIPEATMTPNTSIADLKKMYWDANSATTWNTEIGTNASGDSIIIAGTIISSDKMGNVYKNMMVRNDDGEAITLAIQKGTTDSILSREHKYGQRIVINVTGLSIGKYNGYMEIGAPSDQYGITYLERAEFDRRAQVDGMPQLPVKPIVTTIADLDAAKNTAEGLMKWQSQLIQLDDVEFLDGGEATFGGSSNYMDRYIVDSTGKRINVRCSSMSNFAYTTIPMGRGTLVGLLGYYGSSWQISLNGIDRETDLIGFTWAQAEPYIQAGNGTAETPFTVQDIKHGASGDGKWVTGYIVGCIDGMSMADGAQFTAPFNSNTNIMLAPEAGCTDVNQCIPIQLPADLRSALSLQSQPGNLGKQVSLYGNITTYFGATGLKDTSGYTWGAQGGDTPDTPDVPDTPVGDHDGSADNPYTCADVQAGATGSDKWVTGYIVGWVNGQYYTEGATFTAEGCSSNTNILLSDDANASDPAKCIPIQLSGTLRDALGLMADPSGLGKQVTIKGSLEKYFGVAGLKSTTAYAWGAKGEETEEPAATNMTFVKATSLVSGKKYILADAAGQVVKPIAQSATYGYLLVEAPVSTSGNEIVTTSNNAITVTASGSSWTMVDVYGRYLSMDETHASIQLYTSQQAGSLWSISVASDSEVTIANDARSGYVIRWSTQYNNFNVTTDGTSALPVLYVAKD